MSEQVACLYKRYVGDTDIQHLYVTIGQRIRHAREALGMSQATLAQRIGVSRPSLSLMEVGRQRIQVHVACALADVLGVPLADLLSQQKEQG